MLQLHLAPSLAIVVGFILFRRDLYFHPGDWRFIQESGGICKPIPARHPCAWACYAEMPREILAVLEPGLNNRLYWPFKNST